MPKYYDTYDALFKRMEEDIGEALMNVSEQLIQIWKNLVYERFYNVYNPKMYERTYDSVDSISLLEINKTNDGYEVSLGYDSSKIKFVDMSDRGMWDKHNIPNEMGGLIEYGGIMGHDSNGIRAIEEMNRYVKSRDFKALFENECRKLGYGVTFK